MNAKNEYKQVLLLVNSHDMNLFDYSGFLSGHRCIEQITESKDLSN